MERDKPKLDKRLLSPFFRLWNWGSKSLGHLPQITQQEVAGSNRNAGLRWLLCRQAASLLFFYFYPVVPSQPTPAKMYFTSISFCLQPNSWVSQSPGRLPSWYQSQRGNVWCLANCALKVKDFTTFHTVWKAGEFTLNQESHFPAFRGLKMFAHVCIHTHTGRENREIKEGWALENVPSGGFSGWDFRTSVNPLTWYSPLGSSHSCQGSLAPSARCTPNPSVGVYLGGSRSMGPSEFCILPSSWMRLAILIYRILLALWPWASCLSLLLSVLIYKMGIMAYIYFPRLWWG